MLLNAAHLPAAGPFFFQLEGRRRNALNLKEPGPLAPPWGRQQAPPRRAGFPHRPHSSPPPPRRWFCRQQQPPPRPRPEQPGSSRSSYFWPLRSLLSLEKTFIYFSQPLPPHNPVSYISAVRMDWAEVKLLLFFFFFRSQMQLTLIYPWNAVILCYSSWQQVSA